MEESREVPQARAPLFLFRSHFFRRSLGGVLLIAATGAALLHWIRLPAETPVMRGEVLSRKLGCFACHGPGGIRSTPNLGAGEAEIPEWDGGTHLMYIQKEAEIAEWILYGLPVRQGAPEPWVPRRDGSFIRMPGYQGRIDDKELEDLVAFYKAVAWYDPAMPREAQEGRKIARKKGCFSCHGPSGCGGWPNPGAFKGYIPPWDGEDFGELVRDDEELRAWILTGEAPRLASNRLARFFMERQSIKMPAYQGALTPEELASVVTFIKYLRRSSSPEAGVRSPESVVRPSAAYLE